MNRLERKELIKEALRAQAGLLSLAAKQAGVSYRTLWEYCRDFEDVRQARDEAKESMTDFAEGKLFEKIKHGDIAAIIFYLKTQGKTRGDIERQEVTGQDGLPLLQINVHSDETREDIEATIRRLSTN